MSEQKYAIGNWVKCKISNDAALYQITSIEKHGYIVGLSGVREGEKIPIEKIKPIPLTPEILETWSAKDIYETFTYHLDKHFFVVWDGVDAIWFIKKGEQSVHIATTEYLHQLQNLYFSLTQKELEIIN